MTTYLWYDQVENEVGNSSAGNRLAEKGGLEANAGLDGKVTAIGVYSDSRYTLSGLHTNDRTLPGVGGKSGSTEAEVKAVFGEPTRTTVRRGPHGEPDAHFLIYSSAGVTFGIGDNPKLHGYKEVFEIAVYTGR